MNRSFGFFDAILTVDERSALSEMDGANGGLMQ